MATKTGTNGNDVLIGTAADDTIFGRGGSDRVRGLPGNDHLYGENGDDLLDGGPGDDRLYGGDGADDLDGGIGNDELFGGPGNDLLRGGAGDDLIDGGTGLDTAYYLGFESDFSLTRDGDWLVVADRSQRQGNEGTDRLIDAETVHFHDSVLRAPVGASDNFAVAEDHVLSVAAPGVLGNDSDPGGDELAALLVSGPTHGTLALGPDGAFVYTPAPDYHGPDAFTYRATDGVLVSGVVSVAIEVTPVNDAPVAQSVQATVSEDGPPVLIAADADDVDADDDPSTLTYVLTSLPAKGSVTNNPDGTFTFDPGNDFQALDDGEK